MLGGGFGRGFFVLVGPVVLSARTGPEGTPSKPDTGFTTQTNTVMPNAEEFLAREVRKDQAVSIAVMLDRDPIMAAQVKNYLSPIRLCELLELSVSDAAAGDNGTAGQTVMQDSQPLSPLSNDTGN